MFRGTQNSTHLLIHTPLNGCGTQVNETENALIFWNEIQVNAVVIDYVITRTHNIRLPFYCSYSRRKMLSLSFKPRSIYIGEEGNVSKHLQNWLPANQLSLNVLKTKYMYFASDYNLSNLGIFAIDPLKIGEQPITRVQSTKCLGVAFDQRLLREEHVDSLCKRVSSGLAALKQARQYVPQDTLLTIYNALIKPLFDYFDVVWGNLNKNLTGDTPKTSKSSGQNYNAKGLR